tara:strand:+ start:6035 stop:6355 length:321 start_codon:yes stop_codon:yes gene_type:complete
MIPLIRSLTELRVTTQARFQVKKSSDTNELNNLTEDSGQRKRYLRSKDEESIGLPCLPKTTRRKWRKSKKAVSKLLDELDYNNEIQSSYELILLERQRDYSQHDIA